jgi:hypothetical protein
MATRKTVTPPPTIDASLCQMTDSPIPIAFVDSDEGAQAAMALSSEATSLLTELHLALASRELARFFKDHPGISSVGTSRDTNGDDEGHYHTEITTRTSFIDGTQEPDYDYREDSDEDIPALGGSREDLHEQAENILNHLMQTYPLARSAIEDSTHNLKSALKLPAKAFMARHEAFAISRETGAGVPTPSKKRI